MSQFDFVNQVSALFRPIIVVPVTKTLDLVHGPVCDTQVRKASVYSYGMYIPSDRVAAKIGTLQVAPALHPPYNITSDSMDAIDWTVSLVRSLSVKLSLILVDADAHLVLVIPFFPIASQFRRTDVVERPVTCGRFWSK